MNGHSWLHHFILMFCLACLSNESVAPQSDHSLNQELSPGKTLSQGRDAPDSSEKFSDDEATIAGPRSNSEKNVNVLQATIELYEGCRDRLELPRVTMSVCKIPTAPKAVVEMNYASQDKLQRQWGAPVNYALVLQP